MRGIIWRTSRALPLLLALTTAIANAKDLSGRVTEAGASSIKVEVSGELAPVTNDLATIYFKLPGSDDEVLVANGHVTAVDGATATIVIDKTFGQVEKGQLARIISNAAKPKPESSVSGTTQAWAEVEKQVTELIYGQRKFADATAILDRFIQLNPGNGNAYLFRAISNWYGTDFPKSLADADRALTLGCDHTGSAYCVRARANISLKNFQASVQDTSKAIEIRSDVSEPYGLRGYARLNLGQDTEALGDLNKAIELDPKNVDAYVGRGFYFARIGANNAAEADWAKAVALDPSFTEKVNGYRTAFATAASQTNAQAKPNSGSQPLGTPFPPWTPGRSPSPSP